jgi:molecular chaperone DnaK
MESLPSAPGTPDDLDEIAIGIDLGTTNSVVACVTGGKVQVIPDKEGRRLHPSIVSFKPSGERITGAAARPRRVVDPANTIFSAKRIIGQAFHAERVQEAIKLLPYKVAEGENQEPLVVTRAGRFPVIEISAFVLGHLRDVAEAHLGRRVTQTVITVPAHFSDSQREATRLAGERAGLNVLRLLNEPTAAALAYGLGRNLNERIAVFDLGGGTFDVTLMVARENLFEVVATGGDPFLGGDDMDRLLAEKFVLDFLQTHRIDLKEYPEAMARLFLAAEQIKVRLSQEESASGTINELAYGEGGVPLALEFNVTRADFEALIGPLVDRAIAMVDQVMGEAGSSARFVDQVLMVGGATRVPCVRERVYQHFGRKPRVDINPMEVVAAGAALQGQFLFAPPDTGSQEQGLLLLDVASHGLGVATAGGYTDILVEKNTPIPFESKRVFTTATDGQTSVYIRVCEGENKRFDGNRELGMLHLSGLLPKSRGQQRIEVSFLVDADGTLQVSARDPETGNEERATLTVLGIGQRPSASS